MSKTMAEAMEQLRQEMGCPDDSAVIDYVQGFLAEELGLHPDTPIDRLHVLRDGEYVVGWGRIVNAESRVLLSDWDEPLTPDEIVGGWDGGSKWVVVR